MIIKKSFLPPRSKFFDALYHQHIIMLMTLFTNGLTSYSKKQLKSTTQFSANFKLGTCFSLKQNFHIDYIKIDIMIGFLKTRKLKGGRGRGWLLVLHL